MLICFLLISKSLYLVSTPLQSPRPRYQVLLWPTPPEDPTNTSQSPCAHLISYLSLFSIPGSGAPHPFVGRSTLLLHPPTCGQIRWNFPHSTSYISLKYTCISHSHSQHLGPVPCPLYLKWLFLFSTNLKLWKSCKATTGSACIPSTWLP